MERLLPTNLWRSACLLLVGASLLIITPIASPQSPEEQKVASNLPFGEAKSTSHTDGLGDPGGAVGALPPEALEALRKKILDLDKRLADVRFRYEGDPSVLSGPNIIELRFRKGSDSAGDVAEATVKVARRLESDHPGGLPPLSQLRFEAYDAQGNLMGRIRLRFDKP